MFFQDKQRISARRRTDRVVRPRHLEMSVGLAPCETIFLSHSSSDSDQFWFARERNPPPDGQYIQAHFRLMLLRERYRRPLTFLASSRQSHDMSASMFVVCSGDPTSGARVVPRGCQRSSDRRLVMDYSLLANSWRKTAVRTLIQTGFPRKARKAVLRYDLNQLRPFSPWLGVRAGGKSGSFPPA